VVIENIHTQMGKLKSIASAVLIGTAETTVPNMLAMLCILAVFLPSFMMEGAARGLFVPLALSVGFAMLTAFVLSVTLFRSCRSGFCTMDTFTLTIAAGLKFP